MTQHLRPEEMERLKLALGDDWGDYYELDIHPRDKYPGWLTALIWLGLFALGWVPIIAVVYLVWCE